MVDNIIETHDISKIYQLKGKKKQILALDKVNINVKEGEIFGFLGPNGAGKTTMISILTTLLQPTSGYAVIAGVNLQKNPKMAKEKIALMLESSMLYNRLTGYDNLKFFCKIYNVGDFREPMNELVKSFGLEKWLHQYVESYSSGMKMKLALCRTFLLNRDILFLDEPTLGLDVKSIADIVERLKSVKKTIFLTSHDMSVVEKLCDRIAFINKGKILKIGNKDDIKRLEQNEVSIELEVLENKEDLKSKLNQEEFVKDISNTNEGLIVNIKSRMNYNDLISILLQYKVAKIKERGFTLEDLFLKLV